MLSRSRIGRTVALLILCCFSFPSAYAAPTITTVDSGGDVGALTEVVIGADDLPIIAYYDLDNSFIKVTHCGNATCSSGNTVTTVYNSGSAGGQDVSIDIGGDNLPVIVFYHDISIPSLIHCGNAACTSGNVNEHLDDGGGAEGEDIELAIASDGFPFVVVNEAGFNDNRVGFYDCTNATCTSRSVADVTWAEQSVNAYSFDVAAGRIGSNSVIVADVEEPSDFVKLFTCTGSTCSTTGNTHTVHASNDGFYDIAVGADGYPVISIQNVANILLADCSTANCSSVTVTTIATDSVVDGTEHASVALGDDGLPIVSYHGAANDLKVIHCGNAACSSGNTTSTVDSTGDVGNFSSIAIGDNGFPVISYFDDTNNDLKVAACDNIRCDANGPDPVPFVPWWALSPIILASGALLLKMDRGLPR